MTLYRGNRVNLVNSVRGQPRPILCELSNDGLRARLAEIDRRLRTPPRRRPSGECDWEKDDRPEQQLFAFDTGAT